MLLFSESFGSVRWSHSETHLLYIAEKKRPKAKSYFDTKPGGVIDKEEEKEDTRVKLQKNDDILRTKNHVFL